MKDNHDLFFSESHGDHVIEMPPNAIKLADSEDTIIESYMIPNKGICIR